MASPDSTRERPSRATPRVGEKAALHHLPAALVGPEDLTPLLDAVLRHPGSALDSLRVRLGLGRDAFERAVSACRARRLLRLSHRQDANSSRTRAFPTELAGPFIADHPPMARPEERAVEA